MRIGGLYGDAAIEDAGDVSHEDATVARGAARDHGLMIRPGEKMRAEAARIDLLELQFGGGVDGPRDAGPGRRPRPGGRRAW